MAKVKYYAKENSTIGTHSFYAVPIPNGTLTFDELLDEVSWQKVDPTAAAAASGEEDITEGGENQGGNQGGGTTGGELEG